MHNCQVPELGLPSRAAVLGVRTTFDTVICSNDFGDRWSEVRARSGIVSRNVCLVRMVSAQPPAVVVYTRSCRCMHPPQPNPHNDTSSYGSTHRKLLLPPSEVSHTRNVE